MENDIPVENNESVVCEVQSDLAKETDSDLHSERVNPKAIENLELIDIESIFEDKPA